MTQEHPAETDPPALRVEIDERRGKPTTCKVWRGDVLMFDGVAWSALTTPIPPARCPNADLHETFAGMECGRCGTVAPVVPHRCPDCSAPRIDGVFGESTTPPIEGAS